MNNNQNITSDKERLAYQEYQEYIKKNPRNIDKLYDVIKLLDWKQDEFFENLINYINKNIIKPRYALLFDEIIETITLNNDKNIYMSLYKQKINPNELLTNFNNYLTYFRPDLKYTNHKLSKIREVLNNYNEYYNILTKKSNNYNYTTNSIREFIDSPYSLERFLLSRKVSSTEFMNYYANPLKKENKEIYNKLEETIILKKELKKATIQNDVLLILKLIKELGNNFTSIDLFKNTIFSPKELVKAADKFLAFDDLKLFRSYINCYSSVSFLTSILGNVRVKAFIDSNFSLTIDGELVNISKEEKEMIINDLKESCIPIASVTIIDDYKRLRKSKSLIKHE